MLEAGLLVPESAEISTFAETSDVMQAGIVYAETAQGFAVWSFAALNLAFTAVWLWLATALAREYKKQSQRAPEPRVRVLQEEA